MIELEQEDILEEPGYGPSDLEGEDSDLSEEYSGLMGGSYSGRARFERIPPP